MMDFLNDINKSLLICSKDLKRKVLDEVNKLDKFVDLKIMTPDLFLEKYFFFFDEKTIYYVSRTYKVTREIACIYLDNLKYVFKSNIEDKKIKFLKELYLDLKEKNLLKEDLYFRKYLKSVSIIVLEKELLDSFTLNILDKYNPTYINLESKKRENNNIYYFKGIEEECSYVMDKISELLKRDISIKNIKVVLLGDEYIPYLKRFSYLYKIPFNNLEQNSIYKTLECNKFLNFIKNHSKEEVFSYLESNDNELHQEFLKIINRYYFVDCLEEVLDFIKNDLKNTYISSDKYEFGVDVILLNFNLVNDDDFVFVLGFNLENIPRTYKDIDFFNDSLKEKLGIFTSLEKNKLERKSVIKNINGIKNIYIFYKESDPYNTFYPSNLIEELNLDVLYEKSVNTTSNLYNKIKLTKSLDKYLKYGIKDSDMSLLNTYPSISYQTYSNVFKKINNSFDKITLSYSSINTYYHCSFRYYIENILKLNMYEESFKQYVGTMFHSILSKMFQDNFDFEKEFESLKQEKEFSCKELFYLKELKEEFKNVIEVIRYQHELTNLSNLKLEEEICLKDNNFLFKGIIDKIMYKEKDGNTYIALIDYKTGTPKINMTNLKYGIDMQLPIYVYLVLKSNIFLNPKIIGFYFEQIIHEKSGYDPKKDLKMKLIDNLKLQGYSIDSPSLVSIFDSSYENSSMIKGMKMTSKGFSHYTKVIGEEGINSLVKVVDSKIKEAFKKIKESDFAINPKVIGGENIGCSYCKYQDLCFKTGKDLVYLKEESDLSYLERDCN